jgi:hypothetical protein
MPKTNKVLEKSARLIILLRWQDDGRLAGLSCQKIANLFPPEHRPSRFTIHRDLRALDRVRKIIRDVDPPAR